MAMTYSFSPIGVVRSPFVERVDAPRQASVARGASDAAGAVGPSSSAGESGAAGARGWIELDAGRGFEDALVGLDGWEWVWVVFVFHRNVEQGRGFRPKVQPPRATSKVGVFATRSPHRPNPIGLSAVRIERVEGRVVHVRELDLLDGTPVLDLKPYVPYADAHPEARSGWLEVRDPRATWVVAFDPVAEAQLGWLQARAVTLRPAIEAALSLGPQPHAYRRIRPLPPLASEGGARRLRLSLKAWRADFRVEGETLTVEAIRSGYRPAQLASAGDASLDVHRDFVAAFGV